MRNKLLHIFGPATVIIIWLVLASFGGPTFGKLSSVSSNDQAAFLPSSAQSTKVEDLQSKFATSTALPAIVLLESPNALNPSVYPQLTKLGTAMQNVHGVASVVGPIPSSDGKAVEYIVPISDTKNIQTAIKDLRTTLSNSKPSETTAYVTGPAGLTADLVNAFGGIDGILLLVAVTAVFVILILVYRAVLLPFIVLFTAMFALTAAILVIYGLASAGWIKLNGQSQGILSILVIGAATDYSLLLIARYKEALHRTESKWAALLRAYKAAFIPIAASAATVILALLCLLFSDLNSNRSLGPIAAIGIAFAFFAASTFLPAMLVLFGRAAFWPFRPKLLPASSHPHNIKNPTGLEESSGVWRLVGGVIKKQPVAVWIIALVVLGAAVSGIFQLKASGVSQTDVILGSSNAVEGQKELARHFDAGSGNPVEVVAPQDIESRVTEAILSTDGISQAATGKVIYNGNVLITATLKDDPYSQQAENVVSSLRTKLSSINESILVGGTTAIALDTNVTAQHDLFKIIPIVLFAILVILVLLLRSLIAPLLLILTVAISYLASLGVSAIMFNHIFNFPGADASVPLFGFVFLVALGVDYNIFLMTRVREESLHIGTRAGILRALGVTGSVITSAGVVLAATFAALGIIPILFLAQIAFIVAFGVLLDTIIVRSLLVPALSYTIGKAIWWPSALWRSGKK